MEQNKWKKTKINFFKWADVGWDYAIEKISGDPDVGNDPGVMAYIKIYWAGYSLLPKNHVEADVDEGECGAIRRFAITHLRDYLIAKEEEYLKGGDNS